MSTLTCVDIDNLTGSFTRLEHTICVKIGEINMMEVKLDDVQRNLNFSRIKERRLVEERDGMLATVNTLQETLLQQYNLRDVHERLKDTMAEMERENERRLVEKDGEMQKLLDVLKVAEERHRRALEAAKQQARRNTEDVIKRMEAKDVELQGMRDTLKNQEKETQSQLLKLRMEFGATLAKVQNSAQRSQQQNPQDLSGANYSIFKRKLQFVQQEKNHEIATLHQRVQELGARLQHQEQQQRQQQQQQQQQRSQPRARPQRQTLQETENVARPHQLT